VTEETLAADLALLPVELACSAPVLSLTGTHYAGIRGDVLALGEAAGCSERAAALVADMDRRWEATASGPVPDPRPRVLMLEWPDPPWFGGHWVPEQVHAAGGTDAFGTAGAPSGRTTWEDVAQADPDIIVAMACGYGLPENLTEARRLLDHPLTRDLRAIRDGRLWAADANALFSRPAPRIVEGAELLRAIFTGSAVDPAAACLVSR
jgi:iron complex transport system substrate-binding protein